MNKMFNLLSVLRFGKQKKTGKVDRRTKLAISCEMQWDGRTRNYCIYVPPTYDSSRPMPLYIGLHGMNDRADLQFRANMLTSACDMFGGIMVAPQGLEDYGLSGWNAGVQHIEKGKSIYLHRDFDDVGFINRLIDDLLIRFNIDHNRIFVFGFSMGGFMANRLAIECGDRFRAVCSVNGTIGNLIYQEKPKCPINVLHIHGTLDPIVKYEIEPSKISHSHGIGAEQLVEYWRENNHCNPEPKKMEYPHITDNDIIFQRIEYLGGTNGTRIVHIKAINGFHKWYDSYYMDISYTIEMMNFFNRCSSQIFEEKTNPNKAAK